MSSGRLQFCLGETEQDKNFSYSQITIYVKRNRKRAVLFLYREICRMEKQIPFSPPDISEVEIANVIEVLKSGWITTGQKVKQLEKQISKLCGTEKTLCLNSATAALELILQMLGIGAGDEVITCAYTYTASASVICHVGATPVLVDVQKDSFHMDYDKLENAVTEKTKAVIAVDIAGCMCDYDRIFEIVRCKKTMFTPKTDIQKAMGRIAVIADAAHSLGAQYHGKKSGSVADFTAFSFHAVKNVTTAEGGALTWRADLETDSEALYRNLSILSLHGQSKDAFSKLTPDAWEYDIVCTGYKYNMTDISAAIGLGQLSRYPQMLEKREKITKIYNSELPQDKVSYLKHGTGSCRHLYLMRLTGKTMEERNQFIIEMAKLGVACNVHYKPLPMHTAYRCMGFDIADFPNAYALYCNEVSLPLHSNMTEEDARYVAACVQKLL